MAKKPIFVWSDEFLTHIPKVDEQHLHLVELVNILGEKVFNEMLSFEQLQEIGAELFDYTKYHFGYEEELMKSKKLYNESAKQHFHNHKVFVDEIASLFSELKDDDQMMKKAGLLLDFLINWLAFHILEEDKYMSKQLEFIDKGLSPYEANVQVDKLKNSQSKPLVRALKGILKTFHLRNVELIELKKLLETQVREKTRNLDRANSHSEKVSMIDRVTKLPNRGYAIKTFEAIWHETLRMNKKISLVVIQLCDHEENFKKYGSKVTNRILLTFANILTKKIRSDDVVCRTAENEFMIVCPNTHIEGGIYVANKILDEAQKAEFKINTKDTLKYNINIGVACTNGDLKTYNELLKETDALLKKAKEIGINTIEA